MWIAAHQADLNISSRLLTLAKIIGQTAATGRNSGMILQNLSIKAQADADNDVNQQRRAGSFCVEFSYLRLVSFRHLLIQDLMTQAGDHRIQQRPARWNSRTCRLRPQRYRR